MALLLLLVSPLELTAEIVAEPIFCRGGAVKTTCVLVTDCTCVI
jgi:hypothetical protein